MAVRPELAALHLCAGYGGFELALRGIARTVCFVERDSYAAATLVARMAEARLDQAPVWSDLCTFDGGPWRGRVDLITAGLPCQPFSAAGQRRGLDDERHLWPHARRIIAEVGPRFVFLENVPDVVRAGWLGGVLGDLAEMGFDAEWGLLSAADVGAPHKRERFWLVAHATGGAGTALVRAGHGRADAHGGGVGAGSPAAVADAPCVNEREPHHQGCAEPRQDARPHLGGHSFPPRPDDLAGWAEWIGNGGPEPSIRRGADGAADWLESGETVWLADQLHLLGNGLVPQAARAAWDQLIERLQS